MALNKPKAAKEQRLSRLKDKQAAVKQVRSELARLVLSKGYKYAKEEAARIACLYRTSPGRTAEEENEFSTHSKLIWAYNTLFTRLEQIAGKTEPTKPVEDENANGNDEW